MLTHLTGLLTVPLSDCKKIKIKLKENKKKRFYTEVCTETRMLTFKNVKLPLGLAEGFVCGKRL